MFRTPRSDGEKLSNSSNLILHIDNWSYAHIKSVLVSVRMNHFHICFKIRSLTKHAYIIKFKMANPRKRTAQLFGALKINLRPKWAK